MTLDDIVNYSCKAISRTYEDWICGYITESPTGVSLCQFGNKGNLVYEPVMESTICRATPIRTKDDHIVYENDIVSIDNKLYILMVDFPCWIFIHLLGDDIKTCVLDNDTRNYVIPNIHHNKEKSNVDKVVGNLFDIQQNKTYRKFDFNKQPDIN